MTERDAAHEPVLIGPVFDLLDPKPGQCVVDGTVGLAGHARLLAERVGPQGRLIGLDLDASNLDEAARRLEGVSCRCDLVKGNFADLPDHLSALGVDRVDRLLVDLGVSSNQLDDPERGFSFLHEGPLDMRLDRDQEETALELVNRLNERDLADLIYYNSQERLSRKIAKHICKVRRSGRIRTTRKLAETVAAAMRVDPASRKSKIHPATRTFLALRIVVNREIDNLRSLLEVAPRCLTTGGRFGVISFHSLEDREVKHDFKRRAKQGLYDLVTKRPVLADAQERETNARSRSAKLRVAERTDQPWEPGLEST